MPDAALPHEQPPADTLSVQPFLDRTHDNSSNIYKNYQDKEVYLNEQISTLSNYSFVSSQRKTKISQSDRRRGRQQRIILGLACALLYGVAQGFLDVGEKVGQEKEDLQVH